MEYNRTVWRDNNTPAIDAAHLNNLEEGIVSAANEINEVAADVDHLNNHVTSSKIWFGSTTENDSQESAYTVTTTTGDFTLVNGNKVVVTFTGGFDIYGSLWTRTLNVDGTGAVEIRTVLGDMFTAGAGYSGFKTLVTVGSPVELVYNGTYFLMDRYGYATNNVPGITYAGTSASSEYYFVNTSIAVGNTSIAVSMRRTAVSYTVPNYIDVKCYKGANSKSGTYAVFNDFTYAITTSSESYTTVTVTLNAPQEEIVFVRVFGNYLGENTK